MNPTIPANSMVISAIEVQTPLGASTEESAAAVRAGVSAVTDFTDYMPIERPDSGAEGEPLSAAFESGIADFSWRRLLWLTEQPIVRAMAKSGLSRDQLKNASLRFALPFADPVVQSLQLQKNFPRHFKRHFGLPDLQVTGLALSGNAGFLDQLHKACQDIQLGKVGCVVIVAVDSYMLEERLNHYDDIWRIKSARNSGGFIPGEAAAVCCVESIKHARGRGSTPLLSIVEFGSGKETNTIEGSKSSTGMGFCQSVTAACASLSPNSVGWMYSDLNGEAYRGYEWGIMRSRCHAALKDDMQHVHPADSLGETGAAAASVQLACISQAFSRNYAREDLALVLAASDSGQRSTVSVIRP